jgi:CpXC protein
MSVFLPVTATCAKCGKLAETELAASVNADRRKDLRAAIIDGSFQSLVCSGCGTTIRLPAHLTYIDIGRGQWILVEDTDRLEQWYDVEKEATSLYDQAFGRAAPPLQRQMGTEIDARLVFGWTALREKLIAKQAGLDDGILELLKISVLRNVPAPPMNDRTELRLIDVADDGKLLLRWINGLTEEGIVDLPLDRELYDTLAANLAPWQALLDDVRKGLFVDMNRLLISPPAQGMAA